MGLFRLRHDRLHWLVAWLLPALAAGCVAPDPAAQRADVSRRLAERTGHEIGPALPAGDVVNPPGVDWQDGLSEEEAIGLALWNNAFFQELLADLGLARADIIQAGMLAQPELWSITAGHVINLAKYAVEFPIDSLYLRPKRLAASRQEADRTAERIVQGGIDLIRDTRLAYADLMLARDRRDLAAQALKLRGRIAELAQARLKAGDAGPLEVDTAGVDALRAVQEASRAEIDVALAEERLRNLLGLGVARCPLPLTPTDTLPGGDVDIEALVREALTGRPDARAADRAIAAAGDRTTVARLGIFTRLSIIFYSEGDRSLSREYKPGYRVSLPLWNWNQGAIARAKADYERLVRQRATLHDRIILEVRLAHTQYLQARQELEGWEARTRPAVEAAIRRAENAYKEGGASLALVLETSRQLLDARLREAQLRSDVRRAWAELERSTGRRLEARNENRPRIPQIPQMNPDQKDKKD